ncbi:MAG TPA: hypothetical protein VNF68_04705 [Candidatus Baltobacteraceae bacterium]|nr:hypothetical protein [Candidatus Baltobacteraceae bacterium]
MHPLLSTFVRLTVIVAVGLVALFVAFLLLKVVFVAAVIAAIVVGGLFLYNLVRRRSAVPVIRQ